MLKFFQKFLKKTPVEHKITITINGESYSTTDPEEIAEILKTFSEKFTEKYVVHRGE